MLLKSNESSKFEMQAKLLAIKDVPTIRSLAVLCLTVAIIF